jgi:signal transduction histidine kinase
LAVVDDSMVSVRLVHRSRALDDPATAAGVTAAVRLTMIQERRQAELAQRIGELEAARVRMIATADAERQRAANSLRADLETLERVAADLRNLPPTGSGEADRILEILREQITETAREIEDLVAGVPPVALGNGRLRKALENLTARSPLPVSITVGPDADAGAEQERVLYYVCLEALTNAVKHAHASSGAIFLSRVGDSLSLTVRDDGAGGADSGGSGLLGLADRLAAYGGLLQVRGAPGAGTAVTATIPITRSSATASGPAPTRGPVED